MFLGCGCMLAMVAAVAPRLVLIFAWIFTEWVDQAFDTFIVPLLGVLFLPYTTLMYVIVWSSGAGVSGWDWLWVGLGVLLDIGKYAQFYRAREESPTADTSVGFHDTLRH